MKRLIILALALIVLAVILPLNFVNASTTPSPFGTVFAVIIHGNTELCSVAAVNRSGQIIEIKCRP